MYELREKGKVLIRIVFTVQNEDVILLTSFIKRQPRDTLAVALLSTECFERECCHITLLPLEDAHDFFAAHSSDYASQDFYSGQWC